MKELGNPYCICLVSGLLAVLLSFIENKFYNKKREIGDYVKIFILVSSITILSLTYNKEICKYLNIDILQNQQISVGNPTF